MNFVWLDEIKTDNIKTAPKVRYLVRNSKFFQII